jgi:hypothetical protein
MHARSLSQDPAGGGAAVLTAPRAGIIIILRWPSGPRMGMGIRERAGLVRPLLLL